jgi:Type VII secretion system ESX-1, transport TM domain B
LSSLAIASQDFQPGVADTYRGHITSGGALYSQQEQVHAHRFTVRRIRAALITGEPDAFAAPLSRAGAAIIGGALLVALVLAGMFIFGQVKKDRCKAAPSPSCVAPARQ